LETRVFIDELFDNDENAGIVVCGDFNAHPEEVPVEAIAGRIENTGNKNLNGRVLVSCENSIPESARYTYLHQGNKRLLDHMLISRPLLPFYRGSEIHNEILHDESIAFAVDTKYPESDHAPFIAEFEF
jgi:predicted extracellular nuclease